MTSNRNIGESGIEERISGDRSGILFAVLTVFDLICSNLRHSISSLRSASATLPSLQWLLLLVRRKIRSSLISSLVASVERLPDLMDLGTPDPVLAKNRRPALTNFVVPAVRFRVGTRTVAAFPLHPGSNWRSMGH